MADVLSDRLTDYLRQAARKPFAWGGLDPQSRDSVDCIRFFVDWVELVMDVDPGARYRGTYDTERGARNIMRAAGGPVLFVESLLNPLGMPRTKVPHEGDVGLVQVALKPWRQRMIMVPSGAICRRPGLWAVKSRDAMTFGNFPAIAAWALPRG